MRIRRYAEWPAFFVPDEGEVVVASRSPAGPYLKAAVTRVRRASRNKIRVDFVWLEGSEHTPTGVPAVPGGKGHAYVSTDDEVPLIRRVTAKPAPRPAAGAGHDAGLTPTDG